MSAAFGPGGQERPGRWKATQSVRGSKARRAAALLPAPPPTPLHPHVLREAGPEMGHIPCLPSSHACAPRAGTLPMPFQHEGCQSFLKYPFTAVAGQQFRPGCPRRGRSQVNAAIPPTQPEPHTMPAGGISASSSPALSLATLPPQGLPGTLSWAPLTSLGLWSWSRRRRRGPEAEGPPQTPLGGAAGLTPSTRAHAHARTHMHVHACPRAHTRARPRPWIWKECWAVCPPGSWRKSLGGARPWEEGPATALGRK